MGGKVKYPGALVFAEQGNQVAVGLSSVRLNADTVQVLGKLLPGYCVPAILGQVLLKLVLHPVEERLFAGCGASYGDDAGAGVKGGRSVELIERRKQFAHRQVAGAAKQNQIEKEVA